MLPAQDFLLIDDLGNIGPVLSEFFHELRERVDCLRGPIPVL